MLTDIFIISFETLGFGRNWSIMSHLSRYSEQLCLRNFMQIILHKYTKVIQKRKTKQNAEYSATEKVQITKSARLQQGRSGDQEVILSI